MNRRGRSFLLVLLGAFVIAVIGAISAHGEILERLVAMIVSPAAAGEHLGMQGGAWGARKDARCALAGSVLAMAHVVVDRASRRRFHQDRCQVKDGAATCPS